MIVDQTVRSLEMTSPDQLSAGWPPPAPVELVAVDATEVSLVRATHDRIAAPHHWSSLQWDEEAWREVLSRPAVRTWVARIGAQILGLIQIEAQPRGDVEIIKFGIVPELVGRGFDGHLLTAAVRQAWNAEPVDGAPIRRAWLHTSSLDHPHALANYRRRGFREFASRTNRREIPGSHLPPPSTTAGS